MKGIQHLIAISKSLFNLNHFKWRSVLLYEDIDAFIYHLGLATILADLCPFSCRSIRGYTCTALLNIGGDLFFHFRQNP